MDLKIYFLVIPETPDFDYSCQQIYHLCLSCGDPLSPVDSITISGVAFHHACLLCVVGSLITFCYRTNINFLFGSTDDWKQVCKKSLEGKMVTLDSENKPYCIKVTLALSLLLTTYSVARFPESYIQIWQIHLCYFLGVLLNFEPFTWKLMEKTAITKQFTNQYIYETKNQLTKFH